MGTAVVVGGGVSGLAAAYYLQRQANRFSKIIVLEADKRFGGWINSSRFSDGAIHDHGPRSLRVAGKPGRNTLQLIEELGLKKDVLPIQMNHPAAKNRFLFVGGQLCPLPSGLRYVIKKTPPFSKPLIWTLLREFFQKTGSTDDESIHDFMVRRMGSEFAELFVDAVCRGIFAGDTRQLSMKSCFPDLFSHEREHGSISRGLLRSARKREGETEMIKSTLVAQAKEERWTVWSLRQGMSQLSETLSEVLKQNGQVELRKQSPCEGMRFSNGKVLVKTKEETIEASQVVSALFASDLAELLPAEHTLLQQLLQSIPAVSVVVVNLQYTGSTLPQQGFGHLLPSSESTYLLGVIYDSCIFPEHNGQDKSSLRLTVMMGGAWFKDLMDLTDDVDKSFLCSVAIKAVNEQLGISSAPVMSEVSVLKSCIPQYLVGHAVKLQKINHYLKTTNLALTLVGSSYIGVSINDCIYNSKLAVEKLSPM